MEAARSARAGRERRSAPVTRSGRWVPYEVRTIPRSVLLDASGNEAARWGGPIERNAVRVAVHALGPAPLRC